MALSWKKVFVVLAGIYKAFVRGKIVSLPGGKPLPDGMELPRDERRKVKRWRYDGLPEVDAEPDPPLSVVAIGFLLFFVFGPPLVWLTMRGALEWRTFGDETLGNHVTATLRTAMDRAPWQVVVATFLYVLFVAFLSVGVFVGTRP